MLPLPNTFLRLILFTYAVKGSERSSDTPALGVVDIKNFGPIEKGKLEILPLTVITGPNNSGKSYAALLIRSVFASMRPNRMSFGRDTIQAVSNHVSKLFDSNKSSIVLDHNITSKIIDSAVSGYGKRVATDIERSFSTRLETMIRIGSKTCTIQAKTDHLDSKIRFLSNRPSCMDNINHKIQQVRLALDPDSQISRVAYSAPESVLSIKIPGPSPQSDSLEVIKLIVEFVTGRKVFYLPAARSGILQGYKSISAGIVRKAPYMGLKDAEIPNMSGVISDFIGDLIEITHDRGHFYNLASELETEILKGQIKIKHGGSNIPEIKYAHKRRYMPMRLSSSTVSELAPLILYLKHKVDENSILIIEEPESHLHPGNQSILARFLVRLIRRGLVVVITTHSPFMLEQLNNLIQAGSMSNSKRKNLNGFMKDDFITQDEVAAYVFEPSSRGHVIRRVPISTTDGIPTDEFNEVIDTLYQECMTIEDNKDRD